MKPPGKVFLVGAGPGDPELITLRGLRALQRADAVLYDRLVAREILKHARSEAELVNVGKRCGSHSKSQEEINQLLVELAKSGKNVVRLKSGDPFVFGRGGEEVEVLCAAGIPFEVVPGVTAAVGAGAYCGLPLTVRGLSSSVTLVTGHEDPKKGRLDVDWAALARTGSTLVVYMAMAHQEYVISQLIASGLPADTPAAVVCWATMPKQKCVTAPLEQIPEQVRAAGLTPPSVMIIGRVVKHDRPGAWFEALPLFGQTFVVAGDSATGALEGKLRSLGSRVLTWPPKATQGEGGEMKPELADEAFGEAVNALTRQQVDLTVFTHSIEPRAFVDRLSPKSLALALCVPAAVLGPQTAEAARDVGFAVLAGEEARSLGRLVEEILELGLGKKREPKSELL